MSQLAPKEAEVVAWWSLGSGHKQATLMKDGGEAKERNIWWIWIEGFVEHVSNPSLFFLPYLHMCLCRERVFHVVLEGKGRGGEGGHREDASASKSGPETKKGRRGRCEGGMHFVVSEREE